jgi:hypothetical protein
MWLYCNIKIILRFVYNYILDVLQVPRLFTSAPDVKG